MGLFQIIAEFFKTIFSPTSPESLQRQAVRKIESELKNLAPGLYKNGLVMPDFAEALRVLFINTTPIFDIISETYCSTDLDTSHFGLKLRRLIPMKKYFLPAPLLLFLRLERKAKEMIHSPR